MIGKPPRLYKYLSNSLRIINGRIFAIIGLSVLHLISALNLLSFFNHRNTICNSLINNFF